MTDPSMAILPQPISIGRDSDTVVSAVLNICTEKTGFVFITVRYWSILAHFLGSDKRRIRSAV